MALRAIPVAEVAFQGMGEMFARYMGGNEENARGYAEVLVSYGDRLYLKFTPDRDVAWDYRMG